MLFPWPMRFFPLDSISCDDWYLVMYLGEERSNESIKHSEDVMDVVDKFLEFPMKVLSEYLGYFCLL